MEWHGEGTLPAYMVGMMDGETMDTDHCVVCGRTYPLNRHHVVPRSAGELHVDGRMVPKPTITLCGCGNASGCHGKAHSHRLHFRWVGHWEWMETPEPMDELAALQIEEGWHRCM